MRVTLAYGRRGLPVEFPTERTTVIEPRQAAPLADERGALLRALEQPIGCPALRHWIKPGAKVCITFTDITRATPNERLIPWLLDYLAPQVPREAITLLNSLGTHRPNTRAELEAMLGPEIVATYRLAHNEPENEAAHRQFGVTHDGTPVLVSRHLADADVRIVTGFIEPHFFAGFSGGPKGVVPGAAHLRTVMSSHDARNIAHPNATFGVTQGNPLWEELLDFALRPGPVFLCNVTLDTQRRITGVFAGDLRQAHAAGTSFVQASAMQRVPAPFDVVVTTNSGYPLDLNLYQGVKGMSAGARILKPGGTLILACECSDGVPFGSPYERLLKESRSPEELLARLNASPQVQAEQWQVQIQAQIQQRAKAMLYSALPEDAARAAHWLPCRDIAETVREELAARGPEARVAVLPHGPLTIPFLP